MAESVDALVSNTSGATRAGSTPALGTNKREVYASLLSYPEPCFILTTSKNKGGFRTSLLFYKMILLGPVPFCIIFTIFVALIP